MEAAKGPEQGRRVEVAVPSRGPRQAKDKSDPRKEGTPGGKSSRFGLRGSKQGKVGQDPEGLSVHGQDPRVA